MSWDLACCNDLALPGRYHLFWGVGSPRRRHHVRVDTAHVRNRELWWRTNAGRDRPDATAGTTRPARAAAVVDRARATAVLPGSARGRGQTSLSGRGPARDGLTCAGKETDMVPNIGACSWASPGREEMFWPTSDPCAAPTGMRRPCGLETNARPTPCGSQTSSLAVARHACSMASGVPAGHVTAVAHASCCPCVLTPGALS